MQKNYCSNCGQPVAPQANFCPYCGARQYHPMYAQPPNPQASPQPQQQPTAAPPTSNTSSPSPSSDSLVVPRRHLAPASQVIFFLNYIIMTSVLLPFIIAYMFFNPLFASVMLGGYFLFCILAAMITYNNFYFSIDEYGFEKDFGVFFKRHVSIPYEQIANVNTKRTILDRLLGIARLDVETAGSSLAHRFEIAGGIRSSSEGHLPGIGKEDAKKCRDILLQRMAHSDD